ncbi:MAG: preprotein translocase subunit SecE [Asticcacaulis sp.]|nr:preprotein translocase subunit SecE [Asticcacaulis sp.]
MKKPEVKTKTAEAPRGAPAGKGVAIGKIEPVKAAAAPAVPKKPFNPVKFFAEVRAEARKITWTSWKETWITTLMVVIMVILAAVFFFIVDAALYWAASLLTKFGQ